jgi:hypothetical protein
MASAFADPAAAVLRADRGSNIPDRMIANAARAENVAADTPGGDLNELPVPVPII